MSKGSSPRPFNVTNEKYKNRWDAIFGKDNEKDNKTQKMEFDRPSDSCNSGCINNVKGQVGQTKDA